MKINSLIIAPHSDDAILCLGGRMQKNSEKENFKVLNVFSTCALTIIPGLDNPKEITQLNNEEERKALSPIGVGVEFMGLSEVLLRGYQEWDSLPDYNKDRKLRDMILQNIFSMLENYERFYFPLGIGNHTDHLIINHIAVDLFHSGSLNDKELFFF